MRRVVITGEGAICSLGRGAKAVKAAMAEGKNGISELEFSNVDRLSIKIGGQVKDFDEKAEFERSKIAMYDRFTQFAMIAANEAIAQSGFEAQPGDAYKAGVIFGTSGGGLQTMDENYRSVYEDGKNRVHPFIIPRTMNNAAVSHVSMTHGLKGPSFTVASACASSNHAMSQAYQMVASGMVDVMVTGGTESMLCFGGIKSWEGLRVMSKDGCRPFSKDRNGMVQGEGAGVFVFEEYEHARARGAEILAEVAGIGMSSDAGDIVMPDADGAVRAMSYALKNANANPEDVGYINAHGTATLANDRTEAEAIHRFFGSSAKDVKVSSTKSMHGHLIGGTGGVELLACIMALNEGIAPPTINRNVEDPEIGLNVVPNSAQDIKTDLVISNALAFGGLNSVIVLRRV